jgi:hypothetical protein
MTRPPLRLARHLFLQDDVIFDPGAVDILLAAFDAAWQSIKTSGARLSDKQLVRATLAKYIIETGPAWRT